MMMLKKVMVVKELDKNVGCGIILWQCLETQLKSFFFKIDFFC